MGDYDQNPVKLILYAPRVQRQHGKLPKQASNKLAGEIFKDKAHIQFHI